MATITELDNIEYDFLSDDGSKKIIIADNGFFLESELLSPTPHIVQLTALDVIDLEHSTQISWEELTELPTRLAALKFFPPNANTLEVDDTILIDKVGDLNSTTVAYDSIVLTDGTTTNTIDKNSITRATNLVGGLGGSIPYQSAVDTTALLANGTSGQVLTSNGTTLAPSWTTPSSNSTSIDITDTNTAGTYYPIFVDSAGSAKVLRADIGTTPFSINPNTGDFNVADTLKITQTNLSIGKTSGVSQTTNCVAIGAGAGVVQTTNCVAIGALSGGSQTNSSVAVGYRAGGTSQGLYSIAVGLDAGKDQGQDTIAIGRTAGHSTQGNQSIAIGYLSGTTSQQANSVAIGLNAGNNTQGTNSTAVGYGAGATSQGGSATAIGVNAGGSGQGGQSVAVGRQAGQTSQGTNSVAVGYLAGQTNQSTNSVAVGVNAGNSGQLGSAVAIGLQSGQTTQGANSVAVGTNAGQTTQGASSVAVGLEAGATNQSSTCVAVGRRAGYTGQNPNATAVGNQAGYSNMGQNAVAVGYNAGNNNLADRAVALGSFAGQNVTGPNAICIGYNAGGSVSVGANTIVIDALGTGSVGGGSASSLFVNPIRNDTTKQTQVQFNTTTKEVSYVNQVISPITTSGLDITGNANLLSATSGSTSGQHLVVVINGVPYKIKLENV
jgi:hypothetical protein